MKFCSVILVQYNSIFLEYSWTWLNDSEIKRLTRTPDFNKNDQRKWFESLKNQENYKIWGIDFEQIHLGACGLKNITDTDCEYWGYIGEKEYWGRGIGTCILYRLIDYCRKKGMASMWLIVSKENSRAINLYSKFGFKNEIVYPNESIKMRLFLEYNFLLRL